MLVIFGLPFSTIKSTLIRCSISSFTSSGLRLLIFSLHRMSPPGETNNSFRMNEIISFLGWEGLFKYRGNIPAIIGMLT